MTQTKENSAAKGTIMVVDDNPENLQMLGDMLRAEGYLVQSFPRGRMALASAERSPPDLILLDVNMPEMSGYEACEHIKALEKAPGIPVLFLSALDQTEDKVKGFHAGGVDFISKPFQFEEVQARVETHLKLRRAQQAEQKLLEGTLNGVIRMLTDLAHSNLPELTVRSRAIRDCVVWTTQRLGVKERWQYELAATLCLIGCLTLPEGVFQRGYAGKSVTVEEEAMFRAHPESAKRLLQNIPRLEAIAEMIGLQHAPAKSDPNMSAEVRLGAELLSLAVELDRRIYRGAPVLTALQEMKAMKAQFSPALLAALDDYSPATGNFHRQTLPIERLSQGMTLDEDLITKRAGIMVLRKGTTLTDTWIEMLLNFARLGEVGELLPVLVPGYAKTPEFQGSMERFQVV
jgi:CheY-like chemotaxis protein